MMSDKTFGGRTVARALTFLLALTCPVLGAGKTSAPRRHRPKSAAGDSARTTHGRARLAKHSAQGTRRKGRGRKVRGRYPPRSSRGRLALLHLGSQRIEEIQQALIHEGYLKGAASGTWDESTKSAMRSYQSSNGFSPTGLPDAKSLMKLGLGPHPLPQDVKRSAAARSNVQAPTKPTPN